MALIKCKDCGALISTDARTCPRCGAKQKEQCYKTAGIFSRISVFFNPCCAMSLMGIVLAIFSLAQHEEEKGKAISALILGCCTTVCWFILIFDIIKY